MLRFQWVVGGEKMCAIFLEIERFVHEVSAKLEHLADAAAEMVASAHGRHRHATVTLPRCEERPDLDVPHC